MFAFAPIRRVSTMVLFGALTAPFTSIGVYPAGKGRSSGDWPDLIPIGIGFRKTLVVEEEVIKEVGG